MVGASMQEQPVLPSHMDATSVKNKLVTISTELSKKNILSISAGGSPSSPLVKIILYSNEYAKCPRVTIASARNDWLPLLTLAGSYNQPIVLVSTKGLHQPKMVIVPGATEFSPELLKVMDAIINRSVTPDPNDRFALLEKRQAKMEKQLRELSAKVADI